MNFLAHLYLSPTNIKVLIGNFMADSIKGSSYKEYDSEIQKGILLHRFIDSYTDTHPIVKQSKRRLHPRYNHYTGVIVDIFYDHFLAKNWHIYSDIPLDIYVDTIYDLLHDNYNILTKPVKELLPVMTNQNWLYHYHSIDGIGETLSGLNKRTGGKSQMHLATEDLESFYHELETDFTLFFKDLQLEVSNKLKEFSLV